MIYWIAYGLLKICSELFFPIKVYGFKNLPKKGAYILASNHESYIDPIVIGLSCRRKICYMAKDSLFRNKFVSVVLNQVGAFPIKRGASDIGAIKITLKILKEGVPVVLFPEGTRIVSQKRTHGGVGLITAQSGVPVIPVFIKGSDRVLPKGAKFLKRHKVKIFLGPVVRFKEFSSAHQIADHIMGKIRSLQESSS